MHYALGPLRRLFSTLEQQRTHGHPDDANDRRSRSHPDRRDHPPVAARSPQGGAEALGNRRPVRHARRRRQRLPAFARIQNEQLAKLAKSRPDRFLAIATLPMQAPKQAADELRHAVRVLGLRGAQIGSNVAGKNLDDPELEPVWATAAELDAFILLHPINVAGADRLSPYYLGNLIGNPLDTTIAAACLVFSGVLERHPSLKICLAHGGGFVPYQAGRFVHGWHVRAEPKSKLGKPPTDSLKRFYFDTIVHSKEVLAFLVGNAGADRVLLGSDYPFDMGMPEGVSQVRGLSISVAEQSAILGGRARALLGAAGDKTRAFA